MDTPMSERETPIRPRASNYHVRLLTPADRTEGGVFLPDSYRENFEEGEVLASGMGHQIPTRSGGFLTVMWAEVGDRVHFRQQDLRWVDQSRNLVCVRDEDLLGIVTQNGGLRPLNGWVLLQPGERRQETAGGIVVADGYQRRENKGRILGVGPGNLNTNSRSPGYGTRRSICDTISVGRTVWFDRNAEVLEVGRGQVAFWLVQAASICAYEAGA